MLIVAGGFLPGLQPSVTLISSLALINQLIKPVLISLSFISAGFGISEDV